MDLVISSDDDQEQEEDSSGVSASDMERLDKLLLLTFSCRNLRSIFYVIVPSFAIYDYLLETLRRTHHSQILNATPFLVLLTLRKLGLE